MDPHTGNRHPSQLTNGQDTWRARCQEIGTPGSEGGPGKRTDGNTGTAPRAYLTDDQQALAQRYLIQALRLAQESGDAALGADVLTCMSGQARMLGYPREALQLALTGRHGLAQGYSPACAAQLWAAQGRAHAALGDSAAAAHAVIESERAFERIDTENEQEWARFIDDAYLSGQWADTFVDLSRPVEAMKFARRSISSAASQNRARREGLS